MISSGPLLLQLVLFGSRARGGAREGSDYDLLVVVDERTPELREAVPWTRAWHPTSLRESTVPVDLIPYETCAPSMRRRIDEEGAACDDCSEPWARTSRSWNVSRAGWQANRKGHPPTRTGRPGPAGG